MLAAIGGAQIADSAAYRSTEWNVFEALNRARAPYTDFGAANRLKQNPDVLSDHGYSNNDVDLIANWFFADPKLFNVVALNRMIEALGPKFGPVSISSVNFDSGVEALRQLLADRVFGLLIAAVLLLLMVPLPELLAAWGLFLAAVFGLGFFGANAHLRVIIPPVVLLLVMPVALDASITALRQRLIATILSVGCGYYAYILLPQAIASPARIAVAQRLVASFPEELVFVWGGALNFKYTYPVEFYPEGQLATLPLFALGVMTYAPFSVAVRETNAGRGLLERLRSPQGIAMVVDEKTARLVEKYCEEHFGAQLRISSFPKGAHPWLRKLSCPG